MTDSEGLGPLPESDENSLLQAESFRHLNNIFRSDGFILRREPEPDAGIDWTVELRVGGRYTGMKASIQVKACGFKDTNTDGSISFAANVSNLNYMLNGSNPLYILYVSKTKDTRYAWVQDEINRISAQSPSWKGQTTVNIRFDKPLDEKGLQDIHDRIRRNSKIDREVHAILSRACTSEKTLHIDLQYQTVTDPEQIKQIILESGITLVASGKSKVALDYIDLLNWQDRNLPRVLLVTAFAECYRGLFLMAAGHLAELTIKASKLSDSDKLLLRLLRDVCDYQSGRITASDYYSRQKELSLESDGEFGLSRKIDYLRGVLVQDSSPQGLAAYLPQLREAVKQVLSLDDVSPSFSVQARTALLLGEGIRFLQRFNNDVGGIKTRLAIGSPVDTQKVLSELGADIAAWMQDANELAQDASSVDNIHLLGDVFFSRSYILFALHSSPMRLIYNRPQTAHIAFVKNEVLPDIERAVDCFSRSGHVEWELRAKMLLADVADLVGNLELSLRLSKEVLPVAIAYQFDEIIEAAKLHQAGEPYYRKLQREFDVNREIDEDIANAKLDTPSIERLANQLLEAADLPSERLSVIIREVQSYKDIAHERLSWCRHLQLIQDLSHTRSRLTHFSQDPQRLCSCEKLQFSSRTSDSNWATVIQEFKSVYCQSCEERNPKIQP